MKHAFKVCVIVSVLWSGTAVSAETVTYTYDAKGRLIKVVKSGTANNGIQTEYQHDKVDNRTKLKTTGAP